MKTYELYPTKENLLHTYLDDTILRDGDIHYFVELLNTVDSCCSIALDGAWGSGKTFFVKQVKMILDAHNNFIKSNIEDEKEKIKKKWEEFHKNGDVDLKPQVSVYYDAWENDNDEDPVLSLIYSILQNVDSDYTLKKGAKCIKVAAAILDFFSGKDWSKLVESFKGEDPLKELRAYKDMQKTINDFLDSLLSEKGDRLVIFIDELDRCNPAFAVKLLERIKHYFTNDRISFVFSINTNELQHTIKCFYGGEFDACRYLDRFFDFRVSLPPADLREYFRGLEFTDNDNSYNIVCGAVIKCFHFELREIAKYLKLVKIAAYKAIHRGESENFFGFPEGEANLFGLVFVLPVMIGLKMSDSNKYNDFIYGRDCTPLIEISSCLNKQYSFLKKLLENDETYDERETDKTFVTLESKLKKAYEAIFSLNDTGLRHDKTVGKYDFDPQTKEFLIKVASLLSKYSDYDK